MATVAAIIHIVIFLTIGLEGKTESSHPIQQNATVGRPGVLKCAYPFSSEEKDVVMYWKHHDHFICYIAMDDLKCQGFKHRIENREMILTIPELHFSHSGRYTCSAFTKDKSFENNIELLVQPEGRQTRSFSSGTLFKADLIFWLLPLAVLFYNFQL
ncbi:hypothetical protein chiPu_0001670 [Chiloscyllium punctatum]|uniref:Immunoglobulin domain-containing protein n=1 Tax=Chiloscyllium punctatum TaxID=137246 RepID=A0A401RYQ8_CHIPU|nr:hypothetical protein [Chiloscyllium punctatum]